MKATLKIKLTKNEIKSQESIADVLKESGWFVKTLSTKEVEGVLHSGDITATRDIEKDPAKLRKIMDKVNKILNDKHSVINKK